MQKSLFKSAIVWVLMMCGAVAFAQITEEIPVEEMPVETLRAAEYDVNLDVPANMTSTMGEFSTTSSARPMWDIQYDYSASDSAGFFSQAGAIYFNGEFWTSKWNSDTIFRYSTTGSLLEIFTIPGVTGIRSFSRDDTSIYAGAAGLEIYQINPGTKTLINTITTDFTPGCRFVSYDSVGLGGSQGFWVGAFNSDIGFVDLTGTTLAVIPTATHGLSVMYGATVDHISAGGPYLWVFHIGGGPSDATITQLSLPAGGAPSGVFRDVNADLGTTGGLAGGLFISTEIVPGENTLGGMLQADRLFGYELDFVPIGVDANVSSFQVSDAYAQMPLKFNSLAQLDGEVVNGGTQTLDSLTVTITAENLATSAVVLDEERLFTMVATTAANPFLTTPILPTEPGVFLYTATADVGSQVDEIANNNVFQALYYATDSIYSRDDDLATSSLQVGANTGGVVALYDFPGETYLQGVEVRGGTDTGAGTFNISAVAVPVVAGAVTGPPSMTGPAVAVTGDDSTYYLPFNSPIAIPNGGVISVGYRQDDGQTFFIRVNATNFAPGTLGFTTTDALTTVGWSSATNQVTPFIRPVVVPCNKLSVNVTAFPDTGMDNGGAVAQAVNGLGTVSYSWSTGAAGPAVQGITGPDTITVTVSDENSCSITDTVVIERMITSVEVPASQPLFKIQPNPASDLVEIVLDPGKNEDYLLNLYDRQGRLILQAEGSSVSQPQVNWHVGDLASGMYIVEYVSESAVNKQQLIIK